VRKVTFGGANSLDNYLARADDAVDWLMWGQEAAAVMADFWKTIDTVLMGRKTYEVALRSGQGGPYPRRTNLRFLTHPQAGPQRRRHDRFGGRRRVRSGFETARRQGHLPDGGRRVGEIPVRGRAN
jgi:dihydrofolate reductase